jgi:coenzyme Q-binding protein COQ10
VESVGGNTGTSLREDDIAHHLSSQEQDQDVSSRKEGSNGLLTHLRSTWTVEAIQNGQTQVSLAVEFAFANPMYAALSGGVAPKVAEFMVKAFEKRVREVLERNPEMVEAGLEDMEGSGMKR